MRLPYVLLIVCTSLVLTRVSVAQQGGGDRDWPKWPKNLSVGFDPRGAAGTWTGNAQWTTTRQERGKEIAKTTNERPLELVIAADWSIEARWPAQADGRTEENWGKAVRRPGERGLWIGAPGAPEGQRRGLWVRSTDGGKTLSVEYVEDVIDRAARTKSAGTGVLKRQS